MINPVSPTARRNQHPAAGAPANIRRIQHEMARQAELVSHSYCQEPNRRVRIFRN
jgi:predicted RNA-binding protein Jag